jgi:hypothetical protein
MHLGPHAILYIFIGFGLGIGMPFLSGIFDHDWQLLQLSQQNGPSKIVELPLEHGLLPEAFIWATNHYDFGVGIGQTFRTQIRERIDGDESLQRLINYCKVHVLPRSLLCQLQQR